MKIKYVKGTVVMNDGSTSQFQVSASGFLQWGANKDRLGRSVDAVVEMGQHLTEEGFLLVPDDPTCDVCGVMCEDLGTADWCPECGCCVEHCQGFDACPTREDVTP